MYIGHRPKRRTVLNLGTVQENKILRKLKYFLKNSNRRKAITNVVDFEIYIYITNNANYIQLILTKDPL